MTRSPACRVRFVPWGTPVLPAPGRPPPPPVGVPGSLVPVPEGGGTGTPVGPGATAPAVTLDEVDAVGAGGRGRGLRRCRADAEAFEAAVTRAVSAVDAELPPEPPEPADRASCAVAGEKTGISAAPASANPATTAARRRPRPGVGLRCARRCPRLSRGSRGREWAPIRWFTSVPRRACGERSVLFGDVDPRPPRASWRGTDCRLLSTSHLTALRRIHLTA